jgi:hypothetical protein
MSPFEIALRYIALGQKEAAFVWLKKATAERFTFWSIASWEPRLDPLRFDPRFGRMLKQVGSAI